MILVDGMGRSGTSLLGRLLDAMLQPQGYLYYYEPFHHPTPLGTLDDWQQMLGHVLLPDEEHQQLGTYLDRMQACAAASAQRVLWKEIRLTLKQDWLLCQRPDARVVHVTRDILGVLSSHRREEAPAWLKNHRRIWIDCLKEWGGQVDKLRQKRVPHLDLLDDLAERDEFELYGTVWALNEAFAWSLKHERLLCLRYEDLCRSPVETLSRVASFLDVEFARDSQQRAIEHLQQSEQQWDASGPGTGLPAGEMPQVWTSRLSKIEVERILGVADTVRRQLGYQEVEI